MHHSSQRRRVQGKSGARSRHAVHPPPRPQRRPQAAIEPKAIDRRRGVDGADARQPHAGPLEAAFLQHPARGRIVNARAGYQRVMLEIAERVVDQSARGFGGKAAAPIGHAEPVTQLGSVFTQLDAADADRRAVVRDGEARFAFALVGGGDELLGVFDGVGMRNARCIRGDTAIVGERCDRFGVAAARRAQHEPRGGENRNIVVSPCRRKSLFRESHGMAPSKTERGTGMPVPLISEPIRVRRATGCRRTSYDPPYYWATASDIGSTDTKTRPLALVRNSILPLIFANNVWSLPTPTLRPGCHLVPRWRAMMLPATTSSPPKILIPSRWPPESRPLREDPPAFL